MVRKPLNPAESTRRRPTQQRSRERFDAIVEAAGTLIGDRGLEPITMTDVAQQADMALTALYRYFPNKQAIVHELAMRTFESNSEMAVALAEQGDRAVDAWIEHAVITYCETHLHNSRRRHIQAAINADERLAALNIDDSVAVATLVVDSLVGAGVRIEPEKLLQRALLVIALMDGAMNLARHLEPDAATDALRRFAKVASWTLLHEPNSWPPTVS